ncbi:MAG: hypothetical protein KUG77_12895 [Nannocystaceae bacterium]|nr:hypothetical protein [Nannocystaceae bacterium]
MRLRGLLSKAKNLAEENLPSEVLDASRRLRDTVLEHAPVAVTDAIERIVSPDEAPAARPDLSEDTEALTAAAERRRKDALRRVKSKAEQGLKPEDSQVVVYATMQEREEVEQIEAVFTRMDAAARVMDLDKEPLQTKTQLAKLTGKMVPPYVYINGRYWGALGEMELLSASGDLELVVANRIDELKEESRRIGKIREVYDDEITAANILERWKLGHILCVDDLDAWYEADRDGGGRFYYQGGPRPAEDMQEVAAEIVAAVEDDEYEATWQLEPSIQIEG